MVYQQESTRVLSNYGVVDDSQPKPGVSNRVKIDPQKIKAFGKAVSTKNGRFYDTLRASWDSQNSDQYSSIHSEGEQIKGCG